MAFFFFKNELRAMTNSNHLAPSASLFAQLNILVILKVNPLYIVKLQNVCFPITIVCCPRPF